MVAEVTLACVLLLITGLLVRSFEAVLAVDLGFEAANTVAWKLNPSRTFDSFREESDFYAELTGRIAGVPGVDNVGLVDELPLGLNRTWQLSIVGAPDQDDRVQAFPHIIDLGYLSAMRIPLVDGREFSRDDREDTQHVVLINESAARRVFAGDSALGQRLKFWGPWEWEVVGIVKDVRHISPEMDAGVEAYFPVAQMQDFHTLDLAVRSQLPVTDVANAVRAALRGAVVNPPSTRRSAKRVNTQRWRGLRPNGPSGRWPT